MDRNSLIGLLLIFLIILGYSWYTQPSSDELARQQRERDSISQVLQANEKRANEAELLTKTDSTEVKEEVDTALMQEKFGGFAGSATGEEKKIVMSNDKIKLTISNKGGIPVSAVLKEFKRSDSSELELLDTSAFVLNYQFATKMKTVNTSEFYWEVTQASESAITMRLYYENRNTYIEQSYKLEEGSYKINYYMSMVGLQDVIPPGVNYVPLRISNNIPLQEAHIDAEQKASTIYYKYAEDNADYISEAKYEKEDLEATTEWISFKQQYFNTTFIAKEGFSKGGTIETTEIDSVMVKGMEAKLSIPFTHANKEEFSMDIFMGPNQYNILKAEGIGLQRVVPLGPVVIREVNRVVIFLFGALSKVTSNYGLIILLLTLIIKTALFPLVYKSYKSMAKMRVLKPEIDAIKEKNKDNAQKAQQENMKLYKKAGVNPAGGCLPMLIQMPILFAVFRFFPSAFELRQQSFLWATDLSMYDSIYKFPGGFDIPFYGDHISLFTLLMTITTLVYTKFNNQLTGVSGQMKWIGYLMPIMFLGFFNNYAAGLTYYYFISTLITFGQQMFIRRFVDEEKIKAQIAHNKKNPKQKKQSNFQKRLEEMAKKQQEASKNKRR